MTTNDHDVIIIGARCAGSPTAMLLARHGLRVLVVDRATFPSDTLSTHVLHPTAVAALSRWGVLDAVTATGCPPVSRYNFDFGPVVLAGRPAAPTGWDGPPPPTYAPRRTVLDKILVDAAAAAGAEVREGFTVDEIVFDDDRVVGIRGHGTGGDVVEERAAVVIGADGRNSLLARAVEPREYGGKPVLQWGAYTYWADLPVPDFDIVVRPNRGWGAIPTNDGLTMVVVGWPAAEAAAFKADIEGNYLRTLDLVPAFGARVRAATRVERFHVGGVPNGFRQSFGPGWLLLGDAGYVKDPITAQGIPDAFADAERAAAALAEVFGGHRSFDDAFSAAQRERDERAGPLYEFTTQLATLAPPPPEMQQLFGALRNTQAGIDQFISVVAGTLSPTDFFAPDNLGRLLGAAS